MATAADPTSMARRNVNRPITNIMGLLASGMASGRDSTGSAVAREVQAKQADGVSPLTCGDGREREIERSVTLMSDIAYCQDPFPPIGIARLGDSTD